MVIIAFLGLGVKVTRGLDRERFMKNEIILTPQELEEIKDTIKFREKVCLKLKQLNDVPKKVWSLGVQVKSQWVIIILILGAIVTTAIRVWAK